MRHSFHLDGRTASYLDVESLPPGTRRSRVVLLLHAFPLAAEMWAPQLSAVPSGWRFVAPDFRGFGASSPDSGPAGDASQAPGSASDVSIDDYARDAVALLDHLDVREAVVCGLSMGGYGAFAMFRLFPNRVRALVLADTRPDPDSEAARTARTQSIGVVGREGVAALANNMLPRLLGRTSMANRPEVVARVRHLASGQAREAVEAAILRLMRRPDSTPLLAHVACPTLVIVGDEDEITGPDVARQMHGQIAGASLAVLGHAGHLSNLEQPEAFNEALLRFLKERVGGRS